MTTISNSAQCYRTRYNTLSNLGPFDVICGRAKTCFSNLGNRRFRVLINTYLPRYLSCESRLLRIVAIKAIAKDIQHDPRGSVRFFKRVKGSDDDDALVELLDEKQSHTKVAHALGDVALIRKRRRKTIMKQSTMPPPPPMIPLDVSDLTFSSSHHRDKNTKNSTFYTFSTHIGHPCISPKLSELLKEEAKITSEIEALEHALEQAMRPIRYHQ
jgi:hypothetical protein